MPIACDASPMTSALRSETRSTLFDEGMTVVVKERSCSRVKIQDVDIGRGTDAGILGMAVYN